MGSLGRLCCAIVVILGLGFDGSCQGQEGEDVMMAPMLRTEKEALYSAIQGFVGDWWNGSDLYPDPCGWTPIQGVACDLHNGLWYVTDLRIGPVHDNSLTCTPNIEFRPQLFHLNHLKSLSFFNCFTSTHHPIFLPTHNWETLARTLETLEFRSNQALIGPIPTTFGSLKKLQSLILMENGLAGQIPPSIGKLVNLKRLVLSRNRFTGQIPSSIGNLDQLLIMDMSMNSLSGSIPSSFGQTCSLLKLDLSSNSMVGQIPFEISSLRNLTILDLRNNRFSGGLKIQFQKMESLEELALSHNPIGGDLESTEFQSMRNLVFLDLSSTGLTGEVPESISGMGQLRFLDLSSNNLSGTLSPKLENMGSISALYVYGNKLTGELRFSDGFYVKMGRRFGAWSNPDLCYPSRSMSQNGHSGPFGVKPCHGSEVMFNKSGSRSKTLVDQQWNQVRGPGMTFSSSLGTSVGEGIWRKSLLGSLMIALVLN